ncbi:MAG: hypothetical protein JST67_11565 [Bacteroidetes bacterium]|nr:hypothetical protein [Bacteroidota bacterium]
MKKSIAIALLVYYTVGSVFLPRGHFAYIEQIPKLYNDFCNTNHNTDIFEFLEEQFFEVGFLETDDAEKEDNKPVPFYAASTHLILAMPIYQVAQFDVHPVEPIKHTFIYTLKDYWVYPTSVFHPPKA